MCSQTNFKASYCEKSQDLTFAARKRNGKDADKAVFKELYLNVRLFQVRGSVGVTL
jgi:hypothetical protein